MIKFLFDRIKKRKLILLKYPRDIIFIKNQNISQFIQVTAQSHSGGKCTRI